jgi:N-acetyl-gamma-glutamylphosphate reductase
VKAEDADWSNIDAVICGLPHSTAQDVIAGLPDSVKVIDMSADFRLRNADTYAEWYGRSHDNRSCWQRRLWIERALCVTPLNRRVWWLARAVIRPLP